jgi:hypothetical protein
MSDEFPRPYAEEPPPPEPLSGFRLLRARPGAVVATVVLTGALMAAQWWAWMNVLPPSNPMESLIVRVGRSFLDELPGVVPLIMIAALSRRRVRPLQVLALWGIIAVLAVASSELTDAVWIRIDPGFSIADPGVDYLTYVANTIGAIVLILTGLAARVLLPAPGRPALRSGRDILVLVVASILLSVVSFQSLEVLDLPMMAMLALVIAVWSLVNVVWAIAVLVTSARPVSGWAGHPAELQRQDP